jgi:hypothetical protein
VQAAHETASKEATAANGTKQYYLELATMVALYFAPRPTFVLLWFFGEHFGMPFAWKDSWTIFTAIGFVVAPYFIGTHAPNTSICGE